MKNNKYTNYLKGEFIAELEVLKLLKKITNALGVTLDDLMK